MKAIQCQIQIYEQSIWTHDMRVLVPMFTVYVLTSRINKALVHVDGMDMPLFID